MKTKHGTYYYEFLETVEKLKKEDDTCFICGSKNKCSPHHIIHVSENHNLYSDEQNIVFLCEYHHRKYHKIYGSGKRVNLKTFGTYCKKEFRREILRYASSFEENIHEIKKSLPPEIEELEDERPLKKKILRNVFQFKSRTYKEKYKSLKILHNGSMKNVEKIKFENWQLQRENKELKKELEILKLNQKNENMLKTCARLEKGGWGHLETLYLRNDEDYVKKAQDLQIFLKKHIGKNTVAMDSKYVRITVKKHILVSEIYNLLMLDENIPHELVPLERHNVIYFKLWD